MEPKGVLILLTAGNCGHCHQFKDNIWYKSKDGPLKDKIINDGKVSIIEINLPSTSSTLDNKYPVDLQRYVSWFPSLMLFTNDDWAAGLNGAPLHGVVYNGTDDGGKVKLSGTKPISRKNILDWIDTETANWA